MITPPARLETYGLPLGVALAMLLIPRLKPRRKFMWATVILSFGCFAVYHFQYAHDLETARPQSTETYFVEGVAMPRYSRYGRSLLFPELRLSGERRRDITVPTTRDFAGKIVAGDSCLKARIFRGRYGFKFMEPAIFSAGDGTGSFLVVDENRKRCLHD